MKFLIKHLQNLKVEEEWWFFLLNIVLNIQELGVKLFCHCENVTDFCDFCKVFKKYKNIQYLIYEN